MPMGPFTLMDMISIDVCQYVGDYLYGEYGPRMEPAKLFYKLVDAGRLGEKNGKGFYGYGDETDEPVQAMIASFRAESEQRLQRRAADVSADQRGVWCSQEHIASVNDIDMADDRGHSA